MLASASIGCANNVVLETAAVRIGNRVNMLRTSAFVKLIPVGATLFGVHRLPPYKGGGVDREIKYKLGIN